MISDDVITLRPLVESELDAAYAMSVHADSRDFIIAGSPEKFRADHGRPDTVYLSITEALPEGGDGRLLGYFILALDTDGRSVECRRVVVGVKNRGIGKRAMALLDRYCKEVLVRHRIWLDVYDFNTRGQRVYESTGYRYLSKGEKDGKTLLFYEKEL